MEQPSPQIGVPGCLWTCIGACGISLGIVAAGKLAASPILGGIAGGAAFVLILVVLAVRVGRLRRDSRTEERSSWSIGGESARGEGKRIGSSQEPRPEQSQPGDGKPSSDAKRRESRAQANAATDQAAATNAQTQTASSTKSQSSTGDSGGLTNQAKAS